MEGIEPFKLPEFCNISSPGNESEMSSGSAKGATIVSPVIMFLAGLLGNALALTVLHRTKAHSVFYTLVAGLAWTDLTGVLLTSPVTIAAYVNGRQWVGGEIICKFNGFIMICFGLSTPLIVCAMAIERFLSVRFPFVHSAHCNRSSARVLLVILWIIIMLFGIFPLFGFGKFAVQYPCTWCFLDFHGQNPIHNAYGYLYASVNLIVVLIMTICNGYVMVTLLKLRYLKKIAEAQNGNLEIVRLSGGDGRAIRNKKKHRSIEMQMIVLMCAITSIFAACWTPLMIQIIVTMATGKQNLFIDLTAIRLASLNQTLDPWLYILLRKVFIQKIGRFCKRFCDCCRSKSSEIDTQQEKNAHAHHIRCFRKQCPAVVAHYQCFVQKHPQGARCVLYTHPYGPESNHSGEFGSKRHSLPDVMQDTHSKTPFERTPASDTRPDVAALFVENQLKPPSRHLCVSRTNSNRSNKSNSEYSNKGKTNPPEVNSADYSDSTSSSNEQCNICSADDSNSLDFLSDAFQEMEESDVFVTKTTDLTSNYDSNLLSISGKNLGRTKLLSDVTVPCSKSRFSGKKKRAKSYT